MSSNWLTLNKNILPPYFYYNFTVTVSCLFISGSSSMTIFTDVSNLVVILDRTNGNIPSGSDLFINGNNSYDPNNVSSIRYLWTCADNNGYSLNSIIVSQTSSNLTILSKNLIGRGTIMITLTISADKRTTSKSILLDIIASLYTYINVYFNPPKIEPSTSTYIKAQITSTGTYSIS